jgi:hypothetical protein
MGDVYTIYHTDDEQHRLDHSTPDGEKLCTNSRMFMNSGVTREHIHHVCDDLLEDLCSIIGVGNYPTLQVLVDQCKGPQVVHHRHRLLYIFRTKFCQRWT